MKLHFKFRERATGRERDEVLEQLERRDGKVERLFPDEHDEELASLFIADVPQDDELILGLLERSPAVEFAEPEPKRKLILPEERKRLKRRGSARRSSP